MINSDVRWSILIYLGIMAYILMYRKDLIYSKGTDQMVQFGTDKGQSIFAFPVLAIILAVLVFYFVQLYMK